MSTQVLSEIAGTIWKIEVKPGSVIKADDVILIIESMKMEIPVAAPRDGLCQLMVKQGQTVQEGDLLATIE